MKSNERIKGMVSGVLPTFNRPAWMHERIIDMVTQTYQNWELIIVDDGSNQETRDMLDNFKKSYAQFEDRLKVIHLPKNSRCVSIPRAVGICASRGEFIAPLDDDVQSVENKFEILVNALDNNPNAVLAYGDRIDHWTITGFQKRVSTPDWNPLTGWGVDNGQFVYRASVFDTIPIRFPKRGCDWEFAKQVKPLGNFIYLPQDVCVYFWHGSNRSLNEATKNIEIFPQDFKEFFNSDFKIEYN